MVLCQRQTPMQIVKKGYLLFFCIWVFLAFGNIVLNYVKAGTQENSLFFLSEQQKKHVIFGDLYNVLELINSTTPISSHILLYTNDPRAFYFGIYTSYPRIISVAKTPKELINETQRVKFMFIVTYNNSLALNNYQQIASYTSKTSKNFGIVYKRK